MKVDKTEKNNEKDLLEFLEEEYEDADNKADLDFWQPFSELIAENLELRSAFGYSQAQLAEKLKTKQSVISRFENMGRLPSYDFLTRLSKIYNHRLGVTLFGEFMTVVPLDKQAIVAKLATEKKLSVTKYIQELLTASLREKENEWITISSQQEVEKFNSNILYPDFTNNTVRKNNSNLVPSASSEQNQELSIAV